MPAMPIRTALAAALAVALGAAATAAPAATVIAAAQPAPSAIDAARTNPNLIILRAGIFDPSAQLLDAGSVGAAPASASSNYAIVQFRPGRLDERRALLARGVEFLGYVPNNAYYVRLNGATLADIAKESSVRWAGALQPALKLDPTLWSASRATSIAKQYDNRYAIQLDAFSGTSSEHIAASLQKLVPGVLIEQRSERADAAQYVRASVAYGQLDALLNAATSLDDVAFVSPWVQPHLMNSGAIGAIQGDATAACAGSGVVCGPTPMWDHNLFGSGQVVAISDSGTDANEAWFATLDKGSGPHVEVTLPDATPAIPPAVGTFYPNNKLLGYWPQPGATGGDNTNTCPGGSPTSYHGTHTSGTIVGDAAGTFGANTYVASTPTSAGHDLADGMAPNAQLIQQDIGNDPSGCLAINDLRGTLAQTVAGGAHIHSASWGGSDAGAYASDDNNVDYATNTLEDLLFVVAAGNDGPNAGSIGSPGNAKNALTVGALGHAGSTTIAGFSSRGPTADGRQKPDIMAPGSSTISASGDASTTSTIEAPVTKSMSGTSMATPTVAGNAALMRQFFAEGFYPRGSKTAADAFNPNGAAMKAILLNGTDVLQPASWPNNNIGWGRAWLDGNLWFSNTLTGGNDNRRLRLFERSNAAGLKTGDMHSYTIANVAAGQELRATLTWFDPEAMPGAAATLVNNLDLEVVGPGGTYLGNHFTGGVSTTGGSADVKNTVEQVRLTAPTAGSYTFNVKAAAIPGNGRLETDRQGYALAVAGAFGLPDQPAFAAPGAVNVVSNNASGIAIGFTSAAAPQGFQLYRANGTCASAAAGDFHLVASGSASPLIDDRSQGGFSYAYTVRGVSNDVEGAVSACVDTVSNDVCSLGPTFDTASLSGGASGASCSANLAWSAATASCPNASGVTYKVERDSNPYFTSAVVLDPNAAATTYADATVSDGSPYFYRVTPVDSLGNPGLKSGVLNLTPSGAAGPDPAGFLDDVDTHTYMALDTPWQVTNTAASAGTYSYHNAGDNQTYPANTCASVTMPALTIAAGATTLNFKAKYDVEYQWDGVVIEISTDGGSTWNDLPPVGGYPDTFSQTAGNACGFAASHGAFTGVSTASSNADPGNGTAIAVFKPFSVNLASYAGQNVKLRWRYTADGGAEFAGFFLDEVTLGTPGPTDVIFADGFEDASADHMCH